MNLVSSNLYRHAVGLLKDIEDCFVATYKLSLFEEAGSAYN
jgi:hypothetical protein